MSTTPVQGPGVTYTRVWLLFTFVTNQAGFDTGITIANISLDPLGTKPNQGGAYLHFYGINAPEKVFTGAIAPGAMWVNTAQTIAPGFQGYVIAECHFFPVRGLAVLSRIGYGEASSYLAEILRVDAPPSGQEHGIAK